MTAPRSVQQQPSADPDLANGTSLAGDSSSSCRAGVQGLTDSGAFAGGHDEVPCLGHAAVGADRLHLLHLVHGCGARSPAV